MMLSDGHNAALGSGFPRLPFRNGRPAPLTALQKNMDRHGEAEVPHADIHSPVPDDVIRHILDERRQSTTCHPQHSPLTESAEQWTEWRIESFACINLLASHDIFPVVAA